MSDSAFQALDDLEQFSIWFMRQGPGPISPFDGVGFVGDFAQIVLRREGPFQVQLALARPNAEIPDHCHPGVDTILIYVTGEMHFRLEGKPAFPEGTIQRTEGGFCSHTGRSVRVRPGQMHGASFGPAGGAFITVQKWLDGKPRSVELDWKGATLGEDHDRALTAGTTGPVP